MREKVKLERKELQYFNLPYQIVNKKPSYLIWLLLNLSINDWGIYLTHFTWLYLIWGGGYIYINHYTGSVKHSYTALSQSRLTCCDWTYLRRAIGTNITISCSLDLLFLMKSYKITHQIWHQLVRLIAQELSGNLAKLN